MAVKVASEIVVHQRKEDLAGAVVYARQRVFNILQTSVKNIFP